MHECMIMASSNFSTVLSLALFLVLLTHANSACDTSFNFHSFNETNLILQGDATVSSNGYLQLTDLTTNSMGRAFYSAPIQINDRTINNLASFSTNFTFRFNAYNNKNSAYGLAFALVPVGSQPKRKGLFKTPYYDPNARTLAVLFDTLSNRIEIDVNSTRHVATKPCHFGNHNGEKAEVRITYDSFRKVLRVFLVYTSGNPSRTTCDLSAEVQLEQELDDWVSVGFSATSGFSAHETHDILSWSFSSKFEPFYVKDQKSKRSNILINNIL